MKRMSVEHCSKKSTRWCLTKLAAPMGHLPMAISQLSGDGTFASRLDQARSGRGSERPAENRAGSGNGADGSREVGGHGSRPEDDRQYSLHAPRQESVVAGGQGGQGIEPYLRGNG